MNILLTFDYELFFGDNSGTVEKCMLEPTEELLEIATRYNIQYTFFVDVGYIIAAKKYSELDDERARVESQIRKMVEQGHDVQLHIHPHWQKATWSGNWNMNTTGAYKLSDFTQEESDEIVRAYKKEIDAITGKTSFVFRAGGWCIQPFSRLVNVFKELNITHDSTVVSGDFLETSEYSVDFREAPLKSHYRFEDDVCLEQENGFFTEVQITPLRYSPLFYWRLYILGRLFPSEHKMLGDGVFLSQGGRKKRTLLTYTTTHVSTDGYFASKLEAGLQKAINFEWDEMVSIGHPKSNTRYSLKKLEEFISKYRSIHNFTTFSEAYREGSKKD